MKQHSGWSEGYFERLRALSRELPDDFERPYPPPETKRPSLDEWVAELDGVVGGSEPASWSE